MTAGANVHARIWRMENAPVDDAVGGAIVTGAIIYDGLHVRLESFRPSQLLAQQGIETMQTFQVILRPSTLIIYERDEFEITAPPDHPLYGQRMRITGVTQSMFHPRDYRNYLILNMTRKERAHASQ